MGKKNKSHGTNREVTKSTTKSEKRSNKLGGKKRCTGYDYTEFIHKVVRSKRIVHNTNQYHLRKGNKSGRIAHSCGGFYYTRSKNITSRIVWSDQSEEDIQISPTKEVGYKLRDKRNRK